MDNRMKWTIGLAVVGGLAATQSDGNVIDVLIGAGLWAGIAYGVGTLVMKRNKGKS